MPCRHVSAQRVIACVPRRNRPPTRLRARILAYMGTFQPAMGQTLGHAVQNQRLPTPSRAMCLETHQIRPCPRNHRPGRVRTWPRLQSGRTIAVRLTIPTCLPAPRAAVGIHSISALRQQRSARRYTSQPLRYVRCLAKLETARAHVPPSAHGVRIPARCARAGPDGGTRAVACCLGAVHSTFRPRSAQAAGNLARNTQTVFLPVHPLRSIRRSQGRGVSRPIALHTCQLLGPIVPCPDNSAIRSRRPAVSASASESHLRSPGGISGPAAHPARPTLASSRGS
jgi:hypothetical protein